MGAYTVVVNIDSAYALTADADLLFFGGGKAIDTTDDDNFVDMTTESEYDATVPASEVSWAEDGTATVSFYMPAEQIGRASCRERV